MYEWLIRIDGKSKMFMLCADFKPERTGRFDVSRTSHWPDPSRTDMTRAAWSILMMLEKKKIKTHSFIIEQYRKAESGLRGNEFCEVVFDEEIA